MSTCGGSKSLRFGPPAGVTYSAAASSQAERLPGSKAEEGTGAMTFLGEWAGCKGCARLTCAAARPRLDGRRVRFASGKATSSWASDLSQTDDTLRDEVQRVARKDQQRAGAGAVRVCF